MMNFFNQYIHHHHRILLHVQGGRWFVRILKKEVGVISAPTLFRNCVFGRSLILITVSVQTCYEVPR